MRVKTNSTTHRRRSAWHRGIALVVAVGLLAIPATAQAFIDQTSGDQSPSAGPASELPTPDTYLGQRGITLPAGDDVVASSSPVSVDDGFDWASALIGAGVAMAIVTLAGGALVAFRRQPDVAPSASTS
jgi:hypothetical protein